MVDNGKIKNVTLKYCMVLFLFFFLLLSLPLLVKQVKIQVYVYYRVVARKYIQLIQVSGVFPRGTLVLSVEDWPNNGGPFQPTAYQFGQCWRLPCILVMFPVHTISKI